MPFIPLECVEALATNDEYLPSWGMLVWSSLYHEFDEPPNRLDHTLTYRGNAPLRQIVASAVIF